MTAAIAPSNEQQRQQVAEFIRGRATALDRCETDIRENIAMLGGVGLLGLGLDGALGGAGVDQMVAVIEDVSAESLAVGFSVWAHRMALEYVNRAPTPLREKYRTALENGTQVGVTAMAAGLKQVAGLGEIPLIATATADGIEFSGPIRWASNVFDSSLIVLPARSKAGDTYVAVVRADAPGVRPPRRPHPHRGSGSHVSTRPAPTSPPACGGCSWVC